MIPRIIHYCWFGKSPKSELVLKCIESWKKFLPDYEIIEWNETNCDIEGSCEFVKQAYGNKKWAYVSDFFRLQALKNYGGIYLDTDVEVIKPFDGLLGDGFFCCFESEGCLCTAVIGCEKECDIINEFLLSYYEKQFEEVPNSKLLFDFLLQGKETDVNGKFLLADKRIVYPAEYFSPKDFYTKKLNITENTYAIHHFDGTWKSKNKKCKDRIQNLLIKILGKKRYFAIKNKIKK